MAFYLDTCHSEMIFVVDRLCVHTTLVLSAAQIETIPFCSKKGKKNDFETYFTKYEQHEREQGSRKFPLPPFSL